jgi:hypothetical protein
MKQRAQQLNVSETTHSGSGGACSGWQDTLANVEVCLMLQKYDQQKRSVRRTA